MINSFKNYLVEEDKVAYFTFGRMNPPTAGHEKLLDNLSKKSGRNPYYVFLSQSQDAKKNPLNYAAKVKHARKMFPRHARSILVNKKVRTAFDAASYMFDQGFKSIVMVVGSDRVREFQTLLERYNGVKGNHGFYNFKSISVASAGERDPDAEGVEGMSASKLRGYAASNDFANFSQGLGSSINNKDSKKLFLDVRSGMGVKEQSEFKRHVELKTVSETREKFVKGELFDLGDTVVVKESEEVGTITHLGSNYVVVQLGENKSVRKWLDAVEKIDEACWKGYTQKGMKPKGDKMVPNCVPETSVPYSAEFVPSPTGGKRSATLKIEKDDNTKVAQDPDIKDREGSQPKKYHKGLSKATKQRRNAQFKKQTKMADDNPKAYKPAPGDATAKTKPSKYTKAFKKMYGESNAAVDSAKEKIKREKQTDKVKHDRILDRARLKDTRSRNKATNVKV